MVRPAIKRQFVHQRPNADHWNNFTLFRIFRFDFPYLSPSNDHAHIGGLAVCVRMCVLRTAAVQTIRFLSFRFQIRCDQKLKSHHFRAVAPHFDWSWSSRGKIKEKENKKLDSARVKIEKPKYRRRDATTWTRRHHTNNNNNNNTDTYAKGALYKNRNASADECTNVLWTEYASCGKENSMRWPTNSHEECRLRTICNNH